MLIEDQIISELPAPEAARRFRDALPPKIVTRLRRDEGLFSDVLTLAAFSPLLSTTLLQNEEYFAWLGRQRTTKGGRSKEELLEKVRQFDEKMRLERDKLALQKSKNDSDTILKKKALNAKPKGGNS